MLVRLVPPPLSDDDNAGDFVRSFNFNILQFHIEGKKHGLFLPTSDLPLPNMSACVNCGEAGGQHDLRDFFEFGFAQCCTCGLVKRIHVASAWSDISRVHSTPVYVYDRKTQYKDLLLQYQGKFAKIDASIVAKLQAKFNAADGTTIVSKHEFFGELKKVSKLRANLEQVHCYYYIVFNLFPPDLTKIENCLLRDYDLYLHTFNLDNMSARNFFMLKKQIPINNQFLLYQSLNRYNFVCSLDDALLTADQNDEWRDKCADIFARLSWPIF